MSYYKDVNRETQVRYGASKTDRKLLYDHTKFNEAIEIIIKMLDKLDRFDRIFLGVQQ